MASSKVPPGDSDAFLAMMRTQSCPVGADYVSWLNGLCVGWQERRAAAGLAVPPPAPTPAPEAKCEMCGGPHVRDVFHAADLQPPAPEAKRPTVDRAYDRVVAVRDYLDLLVSIQPETRRITAALAASIGYVLPAPCPPPVAGRGEDDVRSAAQALIDALGDILLVQPESSPIRDKVRALRASIARTVRS